MTTKPVLRAASALCGVALLLLASCDASRGPAAPSLVAPDRAPIDLHLRVMVDGNPKMRAACEAEVTGALRYRGFVLGSAGTRVDADVAVMRDFTAGTASFADAPAQGLPFGPPATQSALEPLLSADLTARVYLAGGAPRVLRTAGTAQQSACAAAAARFATALVEALGASSAAAPVVAPPASAPPPAPPAPPSSAAPAPPTPPSTGGDAPKVPPSER